MMNKALCVLLLMLFLCSSIPLIPCNAGDDGKIIIDCNNTFGTIQSFSEINCGPLPNHDHRGSVDLTMQYKQIGIDCIRTHDFSGPTDVRTIFPDFSKDPTNPANYNFTSTDFYIKGIIDSGSTVFYRLGESASGNKTLRQPPLDFHTWAEVGKHILMHYNDGWADGFYYNISYVEIWNEPDLKGFWNGSAEQYYQLYHTTVDTLKTYNSSLKVGGPCTSSIYNENFTTGFLTYVLKNGLSLDFFSWHMYADTPMQLFNASRYVRLMLDSMGFVDTENINTEWNINIIYPQRDKDNAKNAAFTASVFSLFQDADIDYAFRYRGTGDDNWLTRFIGFDLSLFSPDGMYKTPALIYKIMHLFTTQAPIRLSIDPKDTVPGITLLGGIAPDKSHIGILVSNYEMNNQNYHLQIKNINPNSEYTVACYLIDDSHHFTIIDQIETSDSSIEYSNTIHTSTIHYLHITNTSDLPHQGPEVYPMPWWIRLPFFDTVRSLLGIALIMVLF